MFSKDFYTANLQSYLTFYMIDKFGLSVTASQYVLFAYLVSTAIGLLIGGEVGDRYGRKYVIWVSILGSSPTSYRISKKIIYNKEQLIASELRLKVRNF